MDSMYLQVRTGLKKLRGIAQSTTMHLEENTSVLESKVRITATNEKFMKQIIKRLESWDVEFKGHHDIIIDLVHEAGKVAWEYEQELLAKHDRKMNWLIVRFQLLESREEDTSSLFVSTDYKYNTPKHIHKCLILIKDHQRAINTTFNECKDGPVLNLDVFLIQDLLEHVDKLDSKLASLIEGAVSIKGVSTVLSKVLTTEE